MLNFSNKLLYKNIFQVSLSVKSFLYCLFKSFNAKFKSCSGHFLSTNIYYFTSTSNTQEKNRKLVGGHRILTSPGEYITDTFELA